MTKHCLRRIVLMTAAALSVSSLTMAQELTVSHAQGETVVATGPEVVFSYDFASIDTLVTLGAEVHGAPPLTGAAPDWLPPELLNIGSLFEPDYEEINAAQPDLIIVAGRSATAFPELSRMAPTIDLTFGGDFLTSLQHNTRVLGQISGKEAEAEAALADIEARVADLREQVAEGGDGLALLAADNARGGRRSLLYQTLGLVPTLEDVESATHGEPISFEFLLRHDPDWLFVIDRDAAIGTDGGAQPAAAVLDNDLMRQTSAWQNDRIVYLDPFNWYIITGAGLTSASEMLDEIAAAYGRD